MQTENFALEREWSKGVYRGRASVSSVPFVDCKTTSVCVIGLGYVGLPLAVEFGKIYSTIGYDVSAQKIGQLQAFRDATGELDQAQLQSAQSLSFTAQAQEIAHADFIVIAVPTPVDRAHVPDFSALISASQTVGKYMKRGVTVVYESTVYPGATEEVCIPELERSSGYLWKRDFHVGYSPERINPGDKERTLTKIVKVVAGDDDDTTSRLAALYGSIITAGIYKASSIKVAEAAKVIENTQRDVNIALINELAMIFDKIGIDTIEVLKAASTKWNFLPFKPGLVGGHCIGVDPYYLTHKAETLGFHPQMILAGRRVNDGMANYVAQQTIKNLIRSGGAVQGAKVIVLGLTFKENCSDLRNSKSADLIKELADFGCDVYVHDPLADHAEARHEYGINLLEWSQLPVSADAVVVSVPHNDYQLMGEVGMMKLLSPGGLFVDVKAAFDQSTLTTLGAKVWRM